MAALENIPNGNISPDISSSLDRFKLANPTAGCEIWGIYCTFIDRFTPATPHGHKILCSMVVDVPSMGLIAALNNHQNQLTDEQTHRKDSLGPSAANLCPAKSLFLVMSMVIYATATATSNNFQSTDPALVQWNRSFSRQSGAALYLCELAGEQASAFIT